MTDTKSAEYYPRWSPDGRTIAFSGTKRPLTSSETTMEDTHVWVMAANGANRREVGTIDNRQGAPEWSHDGRFLYVTMQEKGEVRLIRLPQGGGAPERLIADRGSVGQWALASDGTVIYGFTTPARPAELYVRTPAGPARAVTTLNQSVLAAKTIAEVEAITFASYDGLEVQAFLTKPIAPAAGQKAPLVAMIHGGPHGQQGPGFNQKAQIYAAAGFASLMVNYRGSTGYGQKHADAIFQDQNGGEAKDVLAGIDAALAKYPWLDAARLGVEGGSYGGQLANWLITQTDRFKAAIPAAGISNLVSFNYMAYYHDYLAVEFGGFPHEPFEPVDQKIWPRSGQRRSIMDALWERSPLRYVARVKTPTMFLHGENDNDVPIAEAEQFFIALRDVGVDAVLVRYPREGHGIRETRHVEDTITRSLALVPEGTSRAARRARSAERRRHSSRLSAVSLRQRRRSRGGDALRLPRFRCEVEIRGIVGRQLLDRPGPEGRDDFAGAEPRSGTDGHGGWWSMAALAPASLQRAEEDDAARRDGHDADRGGSSCPVSFPLVTNGEDGAMRCNRVSGRSASQ